MSLGQVAYEAEENQLLPAPGGARRSREFSEETARAIDAAVKSLVDSAFEKALQILTARRAVLERGAQLLLQKETLTEADLEALQSLELAAAL